MNLYQPLQIAIDGPVASGKGEIAVRLANELNLLYIYTGAMYRALALACLKEHIALKDEHQVGEILAKCDIRLVKPAAGEVQPYQVYLNGEDVTSRIFDQDVASGSSDVSVLPGIRKVMVERQQKLALGKRVVMEGRDIALRVLPHAQLKIYLTASLEERAKRRFAQWQKNGVQKTLPQTLEDTKARDEQDITRAIDPLQKVKDAWELDSTGKTPNQVVDIIKEELTKRKLFQESENHDR